MRLALALGLMLVPAALLAQKNPFDLPVRDLRPMTVTYTLGGDQQGTSVVAMAGDKYVTRSTATLRILGRTVTSSTWSLSTPDAIYTADLEKKTGTKSPQLMPYLKEAYDDLDGAGKKRFHQNMRELAHIIGRVFGGSVMDEGERIGQKTYAGHECEERRFGSFTVCNMKGPYPLNLHTSGNLVCYRIEQTATEVKPGEAPSSAFEFPAGIEFKPDPTLTPQNADSMARGWVNYLASQALADSLAKAREQLAQQQASAGGEGQQVTPEQQQAACDALRNFDLGKAMANAMNQWKKAMVEGAKNAAAEEAKKGLKGLFKKPRIP